MHLLVKEQHSPRQQVLHLYILGVQKPLTFYLHLWFAASQCKACSNQVVRGWSGGKKNLKTFIEWYMEIRQSSVSIPPSTLLLSQLQLSRSFGSCKVLLLKSQQVNKERPESKPSWRSPWCPPVKAVVLPSAQQTKRPGQEQNKNFLPWFSEVFFFFFPPGDWHGEERGFGYTHDQTWRRWKK